ncbi:hypothetical protein E8E14_009246 [Neopestalotiopsis sp. 37M]|nr:hypothetical protein E8E14_009246 [Neopestalotiopsis sp. 37M]
MYKRLFAVNGLIHRRFWILATVVMGLWLGTTIANLCSCIPLHEFWMPRDPASCFNFNVFWLVAGILEAILDVIILVHPQLSVCAHLSNNGASRKTEILCAKAVDC